MIEENKKWNKQDEHTCALHCSHPLHHSSHKNLWQRLDCSNYRADLRANMWAISCGMTNPKHCYAEEW